MSLGAVFGAIIAFVVDAQRPHACTLFDLMLIHNVIYKSWWVIGRQAITYSFLQWQSFNDPHVVSQPREIEGADLLPLSSDGRMTHLPHGYLGHGEPCGIYSTETIVSSSRVGSTPQEGESFYRSFLTLKRGCINIIP